MRIIASHGIYRNNSRHCRSWHLPFNLILLYFKTDNFRHDSFDHSNTCIIQRNRICLEPLSFIAREGKKVNDRRAILQVWKQVSKYDGYNGRSAILSLNLSGQKQGGKREGGANPLRFARRVFNFQGHQYVPRNPPAALLQSLCPFSLLPSPFIPLPLSFFLARVPRPTGFLLLLTLTTLPSSTWFIDAAAAPCLRRCCNYTSIISTNPPNRCADQPNAVYPFRSFATNPRHSPLHHQIQRNENLVASRLFYLNLVFAHRILEKFF